MNTMLYSHGNVVKPNMCNVHQHTQDTRVESQDMTWKVLVLHTIANRLSVYRFLIHSIMYCIETFTDMHNSDLGTYSEDTSNLYIPVKRQCNTICLSIVVIIMQ